MGSFLNAMLFGERKLRLAIPKALAAVLLLALSAAAHAAPATTFGAQNVGATSTAQTISIPAQASGSVATVEVLTSGAQNQDFAASGSASCASQSISPPATCTQAVTFTPKAPGLRTGAVVLLDSSNNVLGTAFISGIGSGGLSVVNQGTLLTYAGNGEWKTVNDGRTATSGNLFLPSAVALDGAGNLYIADSDHNRIRMVCGGVAATVLGSTCSGNSQNGIISTVAGINGVAGFAGDGTAAPNSMTVALTTPAGVAVDGAGNLYIADTGNNRVREVIAATGIIQTIAGNGTADFAGDGAAATASSLNQPDGVAVDANGNVYIADTGNNRVRAICAAAGTTVLGVACAAQGNIVTVDGDGATAKLNAPYTVALDASSNLYIADSGNNRVVAVCSAAGNLFGAACSKAGAVVTVAGSGTKGYSGDGGGVRATTANFNSPSGIALDAAGNLYIADTQNMCVRKVFASNDNVIRVAGNGATSFAGDGGPAPSASLYGPYGLALDAAGDLFIAEYLDNRIRAVQSGVSVAAYSTPVRQGSVSTPTRVTVENDGNASLDLGTMQVGTNIAQDPATTTCTNGETLAPDASCVIGLEFAPATTPAIAANQAENGTISIPDDTAQQLGLNNPTLLSSICSGTLQASGSKPPLTLVACGTAAPVNSTTTTLASNKNPAIYGQTITFTTTVTTGTGTLTGTVTIYDSFAGNSTNPTQLASGVALTANAAGTAWTAVYSTKALAAGLHSIWACYDNSKDNAHFASCSKDSGASTLQQVVNEPTSVTIASNDNPAVLGSSVKFTATVVSNGGGVPLDGTVTFNDGSNALGTVTITAAGSTGASGTATYTTSTLADGNHSITATYSGDTANYILGSTSSVFNQDVQAPSTVALSSSPNPSYYGSAVNITATVAANGSIAPTGTVKFFDTPAGGTQTQIGTAALVGTTGETNISVSNLAPGTHSLTAQYQGDLNYAPGSAGTPQTVSLASTSTALTAAPSPGIAGKTVTLTASVAVTSGGTITPTGTVTFTDGGATLGTATLVNGVASIHPVLAPGAHALVATYGGDSNDNGSDSTALAFNVILATTSTTLATSGSPAYVLSAITFTATVAGNGGVPTGTVTFNVDGAAAGAATLNPSGVATFSDSGLAVGTHTVTASYAGDTNDNGSASASLSQVVQPIPTTISLGQTTSSGTTPQAVLVATVIGTAGPTPTGTVTFENGSTVIGMATLDATGVATFTPDLAVGQYSIVGVYSGDSVHAPSTSSVLPVTGTPIGFSIAVNPSSVSVPTSQNVTVDITFKSNNGFSDTIGLGCLSLPAAVNCHFSSKSITLPANGMATVQVTIDTNNPLSGGQSARLSRPDSERLALAGLFLPPGLLFGWLAWRFRRRHAAWLAACLLFLAGTCFVTGCAAGFSQVTAAPGAYTIQVGGVGTNSNVSHYQSVTLTITK